MKRLFLIVAIASLAACNSKSPTEPTNANIAGSYDLTITASSTCSANMHADTRVLKYAANVTQTGASFQMTLLAHVIWNTVTISGGVSGQTVVFSALNFEEITTGGGVALVSTGSGNVAANGSITGTLNGNYHTVTGNCTASNHQFTLVKK